MSNKMTSSSLYTYNKCCCCIDLKIGCFILAYLNLIGVFVATIFVGMSMATGVLMINNPNDKLRHAAPMILGISTVLLLFALLSFAFVIVLIVGLHKNKPEHVKAYLTYNTIFLVVFVIMFVIGIIMGYTDAVTIISRVVQIVISIYFLFVIRSHYINMKGDYIQKV